MKMQVSKKDLVILTYLAGIVVVVLVYVLYFMPKMQANSDAVSANATLQSQYQSMMPLKTKQAEYEAKIASDQKEIDQMLTEFPADVKAEDEILYAKKLESDFGIKISNVGITDPAMIYSLADGTPSENTDAQASGNTNTAAANSSTSSADTTASDAAAAATDSSTTVKGTAGGDAASQAASALQNAGGTGASPEDTGILYNTPVSMTFASTYDGFKNMLDSIVKNTNRQSIDSVSATYDTTTGNLSGTIVVNKFYMTGTNQAYIEPDVSGVPVGISNIFGTVTQPTAESASTTESGT